MNVLHERYCDPYAILKFYQDEDGADKVEKLLISSHQGGLKAFISEINLGEVYYMTIRRLGLASAKEYLEQFSELFIQVIPPSAEDHIVSFRDQGRICHLIR